MNQGRLLQIPLSILHLKLNQNFYPLKKNKDKCKERRLGETKRVREKKKADEKGGRLKNTKNARDTEKWILKDAP